MPCKKKTKEPVAEPVAVEQKKATEREIEEARERRVMETVAKRAAFYRANPHRFVEDYLGITGLKLFQKILLVMMNENIYFIYLAARGQGKTHVIALFCCLRAILWPGSHICIAAKRRSQAEEVLQRIQNNFMLTSPNLRSEISEIKMNSKDSYINFYNGSRIFVVTSNDSARHNRATMLFVDEYRMCDQMIINRVLRKFLTEIRHPGYLDKPEYAHLLEQSREVYASSCWYESHWSFEKAFGYLKNMIEGRRYAIVGLPYQLSIREGLLLRSQVADEMSENDFSEVGFHMEMKCLWWSDTDGGLYSHEDIARNRTLVYPWYPKDIAPSLSDKRVRIPEKKAKEKRILSADLALMASTKTKDNDAASLFVSSLTPASTTRYMMNIPYTENIEGMRADDLALIIRKRFAEYACDYLVIDAKGLGLPIVDLLMKDMVDQTTGMVYGALSCCNNDEIASRCAVAGAPKVIWAVMGSSKFNSECALGLREAFRQGAIRLPISEYDCDEELSKLQGFGKLTPSERVDLQMPYIHTTLLGNELINLEYEAKDGIIRVHEKIGQRKDRYSSLSYNVYVARELERQLARGPRSGMEAMQKALQFKAPVIC